MSDQGDKLKRLLDDIKEKANERSEEIREALERRNTSKDEES